MIKRDLIRRYSANVGEDGAGGQPVQLEPKEWVKANVSRVSQSFTTGQFGIVAQEMIRVITDIKLDEYIKTRYSWNNKMFKLMTQVKRGNEYYSTFLETQE